MGYLPLVASQACSHKCQSVFLNGRPPKLSQKEIKGPSSTRMAGKVRTVTPLKNLEKDSAQDK